MFSNANKTKKYEDKRTFSSFVCEFCFTHRRHFHRTRTMRRSYRIFCFFAVVVCTLSLLGSTNGVEIGHLGKHSAQNVAARKLARNENAESFENHKYHWMLQGCNLLDQKLKSDRQYGIAKNVIFFLGDGMSIATLAAARMYMGQSQNKSGESEMLSFEKFPFTGLSKTYCVDSQVADSACSATAYLTGVKGNIETIGVSGKVGNRDCRASELPDNQVESSMRWAQLAGKRTGVVTNMRVTHATPAGAYASVAQREWECDADVLRDTLAGPECKKGTVDIARQLVERETGRNLNVIMGGGRSKFLPKELYFGQRKDNRHLISEWLNISRPSGAHNVYVANRSQLTSLNTNETDYLLGLFAPSHMKYNQLADPTVEPTLVEMTEAAIRVLSKGDKGYYLFVEGGNIDMAHHFNWAHMALNETVMFSRAVERAIHMTSRTDTLVVVTSDHAHSMTLNGYPHRGSDVLGHSEVADGDGMPYSTLSYANGPSAPMPDNTTTSKRRNLTDDDTSNFLYKFPSMANMEWETHGGEDVAVFAVGPWAHLFVGNYEQNFIPYAISYAAQMGPGFEYVQKQHGHHTSSAGSMGSVQFQVQVSMAICAFVSIAIR